MLKKIMLSVILLCMPITVFSAALNEVKIITTAMDAMTTRWNKGDLAAFMTYYKHSNDTIYVSRTLVVGYDNIAKRYTTHYPTKAAMGKLAVTHLRIKLLSPVYAMVIGNWTLEKSGMQSVGGIFSLLWEKTPTGWKILVDHTS